MKFIIYGKITAGNSTVSPILVLDTNDNIAILVYSMSFSISISIENFNNDLEDFKENDFINLTVRYCYKLYYYNTQLFF